MKATTHFNDTIKAYLDKRAQDDELFAVSYAKEGKNIEDCVTYILNTVRNNKDIHGYTDDEVFGMAVHYYDEDDIKVGKPIACDVIVNHTIELTEAEKEKARKEAIEKVTQEQIAKLKAKPVQTKKEKAPAVELPTLF